MKVKKKKKKGRGEIPNFDPAVYRYTVRFSEEEHNRFLAMFGSRAFMHGRFSLKAHFFGQPFKVLKVDKTLVDYYTKLSDFHAQFRADGHELQPSREGTEAAFFREKGDGVAL